MQICNNDSAKMCHWIPFSDVGGVTDQGFPSAKCGQNEDYHYIPPLCEGV